MFYAYWKCVELQKPLNKYETVLPSLFVYFKLKFYFFIIMTTLFHSIIMLIILKSNSLRQMLSFCFKFVMCICFFLRLFRKSLKRFVLDLSLFLSLSLQNPDNFIKILLFKTSKKKFFFFTKNNIFHIIYK